MVYLRGIPWNIFSKNGKAMSARIVYRRTGDTVREGSRFEKISLLAFLWT